ncbi:MAG: single-stranded DNA-binding protein [Clostridia bacterium]|nr:single-stranded DNA-binding protein [Clostridia bacterium]
MNRVFLIGNLTKDPEVSTTSGGINNCRFSVAVTRRFGGQNGNKETDFFTVVCWRGQAENCGRYLRKGSKVGVVGSIQNRSYEGSDGVRRYSTEIVADEVQFLSSRNDREEGSDLPEAPARSNRAPELKPIEDDELPF